MTNSSAAVIPAFRDLHPPQPKLTSTTTIRDRHHHAYDVLLVPTLSFPPSLAVRRPIQAMRLSDVVSTMPFNDACKTT
jgi:hypothetical protein